MGTPYTLRFTNELLALSLTQSISSGVALEIPATALRAVEFSGPGKVTQGGRFFGGGFGLVGAAEGLVVASVLNRLTRRTSIHTLIRCEATDLELFFFHGDETPDALRMRLSNVLAMIRQQGEIPKALAVPPTAHAVDIPDQIRKLAVLRDQGILTDHEFQAKKAELLSRM